MKNLLTFDMHIGTPIFLGGADPSHIAELRPPSLKGVLRFWYRALYPDFNDPSYVSKSQRGKALSKEENLFGSTNSGQGKFLIRIEGIPKTYSNPHKWNQPLSYLGYGPLAYNKKEEAVINVRSYIIPRQTLKIKCLFRPEISDEEQNRVIKSFQALSLIGGLGARSRRGFGSITFSGIGDWEQPPSSVDELENRIKDLFLVENQRIEMPSYTAFSSGTRIKLILLNRRPWNDWKSALEWIGKKIMTFRSCRNNKNPRFEKDHELFYKVIKGEDPFRSPERHVFGLPHNYFSRNAGNKSMSVIAHLDNGEVIDRRSSPLFIRIQALSSGKCIIVLAFLPSQFLPDGAKITMSSGSYLYQSSPVTKWDAITDFLSQVGGTELEL